MEKLQLRMILTNLRLLNKTILSQRPFRHPKVERDRALVVNHELQRNCTTGLPKEYDSKVPHHWWEMTRKGNQIVIGKQILPVQKRQVQNMILPGPHNSKREVSFKELSQKPFKALALTGVLCSRQH